ncbi:MAG: response regulator [Pseudanabaenaceae cyanobacterium]
MTIEPPCSLVEALALVRERVAGEGPHPPLAKDDRRWGWLVPVLLAWGRMGWRLTVIPKPDGVILQLPRGLTATEQEALTKAWRGEAVEEAALPVDSWDWYGCRLRAGGQHLTVNSDRRIFTAGDRHQLAQGVATTAHVYRLPALCHALQEAVTHGDPHGAWATLQSAWSDVMASPSDILGAIAAWPEVPTGQRVAVRQLRILLADDDEGTLNRFTHALQDVGTVTVVTSGEAAWQHLATGKFDVAVCDWSMADTSGIVVCQRLRWVARSPMPLVLLTARADEAFRQLAFAAGVSRYFAKPVHPEALRSALLELSHGR